MKKRATLTCLTIALATLSTVSEANSQEFRLGPISGQMISRKSHPPQLGSSRRYVAQTHPNIAAPGRNGHVGLPNPWETPVYVQPKRFEQLVFNPATGQWQVKFSEKVINQSALDPNRGVVDPGSHHVTRGTYLDRNGNLVQVSTESWTSYGVPHSNTTKRIIRRHGNVQVEEEQTVVRSSNPNVQKR